MTIEDNINKIEEITKTIEGDKSIYPAKRRAIVLSLKKAEGSILKNEEDYIKDEEISGISSKLTIIFVPLFIICLIIYSYGIPNYIPREMPIFFYIGITAFSIAMFNAMIAPGIVWLQNNIFTPPKSA